MSNKQDDETLLERMLRQDEEGENVYKNETAFLSPLIDEIDLIEDEGIKYFVRAILLKGGPFWDIPASFSGLYHPPDEALPGGNVLHTKRVVRIAVLLCDSYGFLHEDRDIIIAAALIHDLTKGVVWEEGRAASYDPMHPYTVDRFVKQVRLVDRLEATEDQSSTLYVDSELVGQILRIVRCHMGKWSPIPETEPESMLELIVHFADLIACNLHTIVDGEDVKRERWVEDEQTEQEEVAD